MDNSQSSVFFDELPDLMMPESFAEKDSFSYESILAITKDAFSSYKNEIKKPTFPTYFATVLDNSFTCITHSLEDQIKGLLSETTVPINKIVGYIDDCVFLLQMLTNSYKSIVESVSMSWDSMKTFPRQTGMIIFTVFVHCRDSEFLYGHNLRGVEKQLKDLFRICHELQLTYLLILEKHFSFKSAELEDKNVLVEALKINLSIGRVVQSLDVKTMAEQWKAYAVICEKYANDLMNSNIFDDCTQALCRLIKDNLETATEISQDDKVRMRSLKVASFTIKILMKICTIFKHSTNRNYNQIIELIQYIQINISARLETSTEKSVTTIVLTPSDSLLKELLLDEEFVHCLFNAVSLSCDDEKNDDDLLGSLLMITAAMKCTIQTNRRCSNNLKTKLISCAYNLLPYSHIWANRPLKFIAPNQSRPHSTFEHVLMHTTALVLTMTSEEFNALEKLMIEAILSTDCVSALFSANLWTLLARHISSQLLFNQIIWLCTMYKKLDRHEGFHRSPQEIHLSYTISSIFMVMEDEDKLKISKQFRIHDEDNICVWSALRISNLPVDSQGNAEEAIVDKLKAIFRRLHDSDSADLLISITNLAATCTFKSSRGIDDLLVRAWSKGCQEQQSIVQGLDDNTLWFYHYIQALVALTDTVITILRESSANFLKVLHVVTNLIKNGDAEMKLILIRILCKLATCELHEHKNLIESQHKEAFTCLLQDSTDIVRNATIKSLKAHTQNKYINNFVDIIKGKNYEICQNLNNTKKLNLSDVTYKHKCLEWKNVHNPVTVQELKDSNLDDFYFDSSGSEMVAETEPSNKRGKPNTYEADTILRSLEENVSLLVSQNVYTPDQLVRISNVCEKLKNISH